MSLMKCKNIFSLGLNVKVSARQSRTPTVTFEMLTSNNAFHTKLEFL